jgi:16S rRNA (adenine1518-N6/adenine1519-N6)-dimethyltransferase
LVANLPYNVASPLIANLLVDHPAMHLAIVMVQREVAQRLWAGPGGKDYGPLGVLVQALCQVQKVALLTPGCFWPQPKVDSAVLCLRRRERPLTDDPHALSALLQRLFSKRRKQLGAILGREAVFPPGIDPAARPEQLSVEQIISLLPPGPLMMPR